jgi:hypothetical protein
MATNEDGRDLPRRLEEGFGLAYASSKPYRAIVYAIVELAPGTLRLRASRVVLPRCCCAPQCS